MDAVRRLTLLIPVVVAALLAVPSAAWAITAAKPPDVPSAAWAITAAEPPPDVKGLTLSEARARLIAWNEGVVIQTAPANLPTGVDQSTVVVVSYAWLNPEQPSAAVIRPQIRLGLGARVPDLTGLTPAAAGRALGGRGLRLGASPDQPAADWVVTGQRVRPGSLVDFGFTVGATFAAPSRPFPVALVGGAAGGLLVLLLLALLLARTLRRSRRRRGTGAVEAVDVRGHPGEVVGPELTEGGPSVSVRLEPHYDAGTFDLDEEVSR